MIEQYNVTEEYLTRHTKVGNVLQDDVLAKSGSFDVVYAYRLIHHSIPRASVIASLLRLCKPSGVVVFDYLLPSPSQHIEKGRQSMMFGIRSIEGDLSRVDEATMEVKLNVLDLDTLITSVEEMEMELQILELVEKAEAMLVKKRPPKYHRPPDGLVRDLGQSMGLCAQAMQHDYPDESIMVREDLCRRKSYAERMRTWLQNTSQPEPRRLPYSNHVVVRRPLSDHKKPDLKVEYSVVGWLLRWFSYSFTKLAAKMGLKRL